MASSNNNIQISELDFSSIKNNMIAYLQQQDTFKDYNFQGSSLSVLMDLLAYNTQYNSFYLNMVANEMFLDSALQRGSVISHAKLLGYTPKSAIAPAALINATFNGITSSSFTLPKFTNFLSEAVDGVNYNFVTTDSKTLNTSGGVVTFQNLELKQGIPATYTFTVNSTTNPSYTFEIPDGNIDTTTLQVTIQQSSSNSSYTIYSLASDYSSLNSTSEVYFLQESLTGNYQIYFGDGVLGKQLSDGNIVVVSYVSTNGTMAAGANNFVLMDKITGFNSSTITSVQAASQGGDKESIASIKYQAPKAHAAQGRAVSKNDYITAIQQNKLGFGFDSVSVWGGEENNPPVYGQVFISLKPTGAYDLTEVQKEQILVNVIKPISVLTVTPSIINPDYTYLKLYLNVYYNPTKTNQTSAQVQEGIIAAIKNFGTKTLNTFNSTFNSYELLSTVQNYDASIVTSDFKLQLQKKFYPNLTNPTTYNLYYNTPLQRGILLSGVSSSPAIQYKDPNNPLLTIDGVYIEEVPSNAFGVDSLSIINPGFGYIAAPTITIYGDGTGATAEAIISNGRIQSIVVTNAGTGYTSAVATITNAANDNSGKLGAVVVQLQGRYGTLRSYFTDSNGVKTILDSNVGTIDYVNGIISLSSFNPQQVDNDLGQLTVSVNPTATTISSSYNRIITIDPFDPASIEVNVIAKSS
jgi:hypothetical protein